MVSVNILTFFVFSVKKARCKVKIAIFQIKIDKKTCPEISGQVKFDGYLFGCGAAETLLR